MKAEVPVPGTPDIPNQLRFGSTAADFIPMILAIMAVIVISNLKEKE